MVLSATLARSTSSITWCWGSGGLVGGGWERVRDEEGARPSPVPSIQSERAEWTKEGRTDLVDAVDALAAGADAGHAGDGVEGQVLAHGQVVEEELLLVHVACIIHRWGVGVRHLFGWWCSGERARREDRWVHLDAPEPIVGLGLPHTYTHIRTHRC